MQEMQVWSLGQEDPLEEEMAAHSSILSLEIPWTEEPGGLYPSSVQSLSSIWLFANPWTAAPGFPVHYQLLEFSQTSCSLSNWCHPTISFSVVTFSSCLHSFPASSSFPVNQFYIFGGQIIGALASVLPMNIQDWFPLGLTSLISLQSKRLSRIFSNTTVQKHIFFSAQLSLWSNSHIHMWLLEKSELWLYRLCWYCLCFLIWCLGWSYLFF